MLPDIVIIVLRETLEAGILLSLLISLTKRYQIKPNWLLFALGIGVLAAGLYASNLRTVATWFDYVGQDIVDASLQYGIYFAILLLYAILILTEQSLNKSWIRNIAIIIIILALTREGAEIILFYSGYLSQGNIDKALISGMIGLILGSCIGALVYYSLNLTPTRLQQRIQLIMLILIGCGMIIQGNQLLLQADWLPVTQIAWDSNFLLAENSLPGQLLYAVFGYEATPSILEVILYLLAFLAFIILTLVKFRLTSQKGTHA